MVRLRLVGRTHRVSRPLLPFSKSKLPLAAYCFRKHFNLTYGSHYAVAAYEDGELVGFFRFDRHQSSTVLVAVGTWVSKGHRRQGLAKKMWAYAIKKMGTKRIAVYTASAFGRAFVASLTRDEAFSSHLRAYARTWGLTANSKQKAG